MFVVRSSCAASMSIRLLFLSLPSYVTQQNGTATWAPLFCSPFVYSSFFTMAAPDIFYFYFWLGQRRLNQLWYFKLHAVGKILFTSSFRASKRVTYERSSWIGPSRRPSTSRKFMNSSWKTVTEWVCSSFWSFCQQILNDELKIKRVSAKFVPSLIAE